jgi:hypothetical protein
MTAIAHTQRVAPGARGVAHGVSNPPGTLASAHVAMIKRFVRSVLMASGVVLIILAVMSVKYAVFFPRFVH